MAMRTKRKDSRLSEPVQRYIPFGIDQTGHRMQTAKLFRNGRSQAVRLPKEFRFEGDEVYVKRVSGGVILLSKRDPWASIGGLRPCRSEASHLAAQAAGQSGRSSGVDASARHGHLHRAIR